VRFPEGAIERGDIEESEDIAACEPSYLRDYLRVYGYFRAILTLASGVVTLTPLVLETV